MKFSNSIYLLNIILDSAMTVINLQNNNYLFIVDIVIVIYFSTLVIYNSN